MAVKILAIIMIWVGSVGGEGIDNEPRTEVAPLSLCASDMSKISHEVSWG